MLSLLWIFSFIIEKGFTQYPVHMDFEKISEFDYKNEKYKVLRPSIHVLKDYFADYMMRRDTSKFPTKRILIDSGGFRHYWSGLENSLTGPKKSKLVFRKTNEITEEKLAILPLKKPVEIDSRFGTEGLTKATSKPTRTRDKLSIKDHPLVEVISKLESRIKSATEETTKNETELKATTKAPTKSRIKLNKKTNGTGKTTRTLATTTFYCPFLGILKTQMLLD